MVLLFRILLAVYIVSIHLFSFLLVKTQKQQIIEGKEYVISDGKILFTGALGGGLGAYLALFILKHKRDSISLMVLLPIFIALSIYLISMGIVIDFGIN